MNNSKVVIADNISRLKSMRSITLRELSDLTGINHSTLKSWSQCKSCPRLKMLDLFCDKLHMHTSDMIEEGTRFLTPFSERNDSHKRFVKNFITQCNEHQLLNINDILTFLNNDDIMLNEGIDYDIISIDALQSYKRKTNGRQIPIKKLDFVADQFKIESFRLLR